MKKTLITVLAIVPLALFGQIKPSVSKAEKALNDMKLDEAKAIIDATTASQEFMVDKKGQPSKNAAKAWYVKGLIYFAMDTTKKEAFKSLDPNPFAVGKECFAKSREIDKDQSFTVNDKVGFPLLTTQLEPMLGGTYYNNTIIAYNEKKDVKAVNALSEKTLYFIPNDTSFLLVAGGVFALSAGEDDRALELLDTYVKQGGNSPEGYTMRANIYLEKKKDNAAALKVLEEAKVKFPKSRDIRAMELNVFLGEKKYDEATKMVEKELTLDPSKENYFLYGQLNRDLGHREKAKEAFSQVMKMDATHFDATAELAQLYWADALEVKSEMGKLGTSKADMTKKLQLDGVYVEKLKIYLPYVKNCLKLQPDNIQVLYALLTVYQDLDDKPNVEATKKKLKALGEG